MRRRKRRRGTLVATRKSPSISQCARLFARKTQLLRAVDGVALAVRRGETMGSWREGGCGKSTLGRLFCGSSSPPTGASSTTWRDIGGASASEMRPLRRKMQIIFQDPIRA